MPNAARFTADTEENFRHNLRLIRESLGLTQEQLAATLTERGLPFHQQTVQKIERGDRKVKLLEGVAIASALGATVETMLGPPYQFMMEERLIGATRRVHERLEVLTDHAMQYAIAANELRQVVQELKDSGVQPEERGFGGLSVPYTLGNRLWLAIKELEHTPEEAVQVGQNYADLLRQQNKDADEAADWEASQQSDMERGK